MKQDEEKAPKAEMQAEYDFRGGVRGKYVARYAEGTTTVFGRTSKRRRKKLPGRRKGR
jgi:hypothetical protein